MTPPIFIRRHRFVKALAAALRDPCRVPPGSRIVLATSGGADSVALLRSLAALAGQREWSLQLHVAHVHHHLRPEAEAEARFVADLAASLDLPFHRRDIRPAEWPGNLESNARRLRYAALTEIAAEVRADLIATAHHADDQLETLLMRLVRGAGVRGLAGIAPRRKVRGCEASLIRPMLHVDHAAAMEFLREIDQPWCEDTTNLDTTRWRARLRSEVLPVLRSLRPGAAVKAAESADRQREAAQLIRRLATGAAAAHITKTDEHTAAMPRSAARQLPRELLGELIRAESRKLGAPADAPPARMVQRIAAAARDHRGDLRRFEIAGGITVEINADSVTWVKSPGSI